MKDEEYHLTPFDWMGILLMLVGVIALLLMAGCISVLIAASF